MKKLILCFLILMLACVALFACDEPAPHEHSYSEEWSHDLYEHWHAADCEHTDEEIGRADHMYDGSIKVRETCTEPGVHTLTCSICGFATDIDVPPTHRFADGVCLECGAAEIKA